MRALAEVLILSLACGPLGVWVLLYRDAYAAESISHGMLPGLVIAALAGIPLLFGALGGVLVAAAGHRARGARPAARHRRGRRGGRLGAARARRDARAVARDPAAPAGAAVRRPAGRDAAATSPSPACSPAAVALALAAGHRSLALVGFDRGSARALGARPARWELALLVVLAVTTVAAVQGLGNLLLVALILAPGGRRAAALPPARRRARALGRARRAGRRRGLAALLPPGDRRGRVGGAVRGRGRRRWRCWSRALAA